MDGMSLLEENMKTVERLTEHLGKKNVLESSVPRERRAFVLIPRENLTEAVTYLKEKEDFQHIATITALDTGEGLEVVYHLRRKDLVLNLKVRAPYDDPKVPSISGIINGAILYEREIHDLVGVVPEGHPDLKRLILGEDWPEGVYPLRKEYDVKSLREKVDGKVWGKDE